MLFMTYYLFPNSNNIVLFFLFFTDILCEESTGSQFIPMKKVSICYQLYNMRKIAKTHSPSKISERHLKPTV